MNKKKSVLIISAAIVVVLGLAVYGGIGLYSKMNQVKDLNEQVAEAADDDGQEPADKPGGATSPGPSGGEESLPEPGTAEGQETGGAEAPQTETEQDSAPDRPAADAGQPRGTTASETGGRPEATPGQEASGRETPPPGDSGSGGNTTDAAPPPEDKEKRKSEIDAAIATEMEKLRTACTAASSSLARRIAQELKDGGDASIREQYLLDVVAAEAECDTQFAGLVGEAEQQYAAAGIDDQSLPDWRAEYNGAKERARSDALREIANAMN